MVPWDASLKQYLIKRAINSVKEGDSHSLLFLGSQSRINNNNNPIAEGKYDTTIITVNNKIIVRNGKVWCFKMCMQI